jgi:TetR/AcrR family transcriptional regulator
MDATRITLLALDLFGSPGWSADKEIQRLYALSNHAGRHYRRIILSKRHGGQRLVLAPDYLLKTVQRNILKNVLSQFPLSPFATAYRPGCPIVSNAQPHCQQQQILKLDIENFFDSISWLQVIAWVPPGKCLFSGVFCNMAEKQTAKRNRREEILQSLALMLESSDGSQRITTAKLAASVGVSEAALYRHFPSKTRMFDSLIEFIEDSLITRINLILKDEKDTTARLRLIVLLLLGFGERNPGLTRILTGHALMFEQDRLQGRINQLFERIEAQLRQVLREKRMREGEGYTTDETLLASQLLAFCEGMLSRFVRSEFKYRPTDDFDTRWPLIAAQLQ